MDAAALDSLITESKSVTQLRNDLAKRDFGLGSHARYQLDLELRIVTFFDTSDKAEVIAKIVPVGSLSLTAHSWLWSWENETIPGEASQPMLQVRSFGEAHDIPPLTQTFTPCDDALAWALAAISLKLLDAAGVYRIGQAKTGLYLLLFDLKHVAKCSI